VSRFGVPDPGAPSLVLALALWLAMLAPQWVLLLLGVKHLARFREAVARRSGLKLLAVCSWMGAVGLAIIGTAIVCSDLLGPERLEVQRFVKNATLAQEGLLVIVGILLASRRRAGRDAPAPNVRKQPSRRYLSRFLVGLVVTAVVLVGLAFGPFAGRPAQAQIWRALAFAVAGLGMTIVLLLRAGKRSALTPAIRRETGEMRGGNRDAATVSDDSDGRARHTVRPENTVRPANTQAVKGGLTPVDAPSTETTFRYKYTWAFCALTVALDSLIVMVVIGLIRSGSFADAVLVALICLGGISFIGWFVITSLADVVVSETGVSRCLWGRTLREISWGNIKKIRVFKMYHRAYRRKVRVFHVIPVRPSGFRLTPSGKICFDEPEDISALIEHMNQHIAAHGIPVEVKVGTSWSDPASWSTRNRIDPIPEIPP